MTIVTLDCEACGPFQTVESDDADELSALLADASVEHHSMHAAACPACSAGDGREHEQGDHPTGIIYRPGTIKPFTASNCTASEVEQSGFSVG